MALEQEQDEEEKLVDDHDGIELAHAASTSNGVEAGKRKATRPASSYKDFETIDWLEYNSVARHDRDAIEHLKGWRGWFRRMSEYAKPWIIVALSGFTIGTLAAILDIWHYWMADLRLGYCTTGWALNKQFCCWGAEEGSCAQWHMWSGADQDGNNGVFAIGYAAFIGFALVFGLIAALIVKFYAPFAAGSGIPEVKVIIGGFVFHRYLSLRTLFFKILALKGARIRRQSAAVSTSLNLGKEGPMVHLAACAASVWMGLFKSINSNEAVRRDFLASSTAAGVSAAFGAPIGGVLFAYECLREPPPPPRVQEAAVNFPTRTMLRSLVAAGFASLALKVIDPFRTGRIVEFVAEYDSTQLWRLFELVNFALIGVIGGLAGSFFIVFNVRLNRWRKRSVVAKWQVTEVVVIVLISCLLQYPMEISRLPSGHLMGDLFNPCGSGHDSLGLCNPATAWPVIGKLVATSAMKLVLMTITIGLKVPAGLFIPSLALGSCFGRAFGMAMEQVILTNPSYFWWAQCPTDGACVNAGIYAVAGAFATLTGVTRVTISLVIIAMELTGAIQYLLPLILTMVIAKWTAEAVHHKGIYLEQITAAGYPYLDNAEEYVHPTTAQQIMTSNLRVIVADQVSLSELETLLQESKVDGFPVVDGLGEGNNAERHIVGYLSRFDIAAGLDRARRDDLPFSRLARLSPPQAGQHPSSSSGAVAWDTGHGARMPAATDDMFDLRPYLTVAPMIVPAQQSVETTYELFVRLGLRFVLVEDRGSLVGLITKKDLIRHLMATEGLPLTNLKF